MKDTDDDEKPKHCRCADEFGNIIVCPKALVFPRDPEFTHSRHCHALCRHEGEKCGESDKYNRECCASIILLYQPQYCQMSCIKESKDSEKRCHCIDETYSKSGEIVNCKDERERLMNLRIKEPVTDPGPCYGA